MAVYKRSYKPYDGALTPEWSRFTVVSRFALRELFESRLLTIFVVLCFVPFLGEVAGIYLANSAAARAVLGVRDNAGWIRPQVFLQMLGFQGGLAFLLASWTAPMLVSPDLVNGALPLFLSRPLSRTEYVLGKAGALLLLLSLVTWVPLLTVFALQAGLAESGWLAANARIGWATFAGASIWIVVLTLLGLAVSAWIKWRLLASGALFGVLFMGAAFGEVGHGVLRNSWVRLVNLSYLINTVWANLFGIPWRGARGDDLPVWAAWLGLIAACAIFVALLDRRLQAREVVR
jgi:hypothetical protein